MNDKLRMKLNRILCYVLATIMAFSVVVAVASGIASAMFRSQTYVQSNFEDYNKQLLKEVNIATEAVADESGLPAKAFTNSIREGHVQTVLHQVAGNLVYGYRTDFSDSTYLYGYYRTGIINYCKTNGIPMSEQDIVKEACFAVDTFNQVCGDESTAFVVPFYLAQSKKPFYAIVVCLAIFIVCAILIDVLNFGRHRKNSFIGMSLVTAGDILILVPIFAILMKYSSRLHFSDVDVYNMGIASTIDNIFKVLALAGVFILIAGGIVLKMNYNYYKRKTIKVKTDHDINVKLRREHHEEHKKDAENNENGDVNNNQKSNLNDKNDDLNDSVSSINN